MRIVSLQQTSLLRKFLIFFLLVSVIPLCVLFYLYYEIRHDGQLQLSVDDITRILLWVILGIVCGYWAMRTMIMNIIQTARQGQQAIASTLNVAAATHDESNEALQLQRTFNTVTTKLQEDRRNLEAAKKTLHSVLTKISVGLSSNQNVSGFLHLIVDTATEALDAQIGLALLTDKDTHMLRVKTFIGKEPVDVHQIAFSADDSAFAACMKNKASVQINSLDEIKEDERKFLSQFPLPIICAPMLINDEALGVLVVLGKHSSSTFNEDDLSLLYNMALQAAVAINNDSLRILANIDPLTGIYNYRHMSAVLDYETIRLKRYPGNLSLLLMDIDGFKPYNDTFGHPEGDKLLIGFSKAVSSKLRSSDVFCRYGGDEFAIILPQTPIPGALVVANKVIECAAALNINRQISLSIGGAEWIHPMTRHDLLVKADKALYNAKAQGKNKVLII